MRFCVSCVYWTLLLVSVVSSGLLFLIVASEGTHVSDKPRGIDQEENIQLEYVVKEVSEVRSESADNQVPDVRARPTVKTEQEHFHAASNGEPADEKTLEKESESEHNLNVLKQSLTPQPNFSQGISETGQAVVLTLVDTAAAELQSLAEPRLSSDIRSRSLPKNITLRTTTTGTIPATTSTTSTKTLSSFEADRATEHETKSSSNPLPIVPVATETSDNATKTPDDHHDEVTSSQDTGQQASDFKDDLLVARPEQKSGDETTARKPEDTREDEPKDESVKPEDNLSASPELDDGAVRAKLVGGSSDDAAAVILDGLVASGSTDHHHEDIPSFSEWAQKRLEEAEKKKSHPNASIQNPGGPGRGLGGMKVRSKNYASPDCGAKIVAVNPEARSARSVLVSTRDEYMLNPCTSRVWFVVELCEAIQAKKIELANFELFSSSPKDFSVHVSDRFPTRDWSPVGQFAAKDQRDIQSFSLSPHLFGKFIKVELHSHYGSEHFCPISLFRAYGTSEFEVLETETDHQESEEAENNEDEDEDEALDSEAGAETRNLFGSARDAVLRIVKKAAEVLVKTGDPSSNATKIQDNIEGGMTGNSFATCMTPRHTINCPNCEKNRFSVVYKLFSCRATHLDDILSNGFVNETLRTGDVCLSHGFDVANLSKSKSNSSSSILEENEIESLKRRFLLSRNARLNFLVSIYSPEYITALCNVIGAKESRLVLNTSHESSRSNVSVDSSTKIDANAASPEAPEPNGQPRLVTSSPCQPEVDGNSCQNSGATKETKVSKIQGSASSEQETPSSMSPESTTTKSESLASQIKPTKALSREDIRKESSIPILEPSKDPNEESIQPEVLTTPSPALNVATATTRIIEEPDTLQSPLESTTQILTTLVTPPATSTSRDSPQDLNPANQENTHENSATMKQENVEPDSKSSGKPENGEQEAKLIAQDQMSLDSILSDLKDLEADGTNIQGNANHNANIVAQPTASSTPQQKESVFLRLSNRIKALERNMSLSGQYLEELSKRYKKQVEEMQRSLERATSAMSEESRKGEERDLRRIEEITALRSEITSLTESMEMLLYDRNSWRSKLSSVCQHFALVVVEIVVFMLLVSYCRRSSEFEDVEERSVPMENDVQRRRSTGATSTCPGTSKKSKKRRPSEIASRIGGTYRDLMIDDRPNRETKKEKKKRRKRESNGRTVNGETRKEPSPEDNIPGGTVLPSRRSSSTEPMSSHARQLELRKTRRRPDSAPEYSGLWIDNSSIIEGSVLDENFENVDELENKNNRRSFIEEMRALNFSSDVPIDESHEQQKSTGLSLFRGGGFFKAAKLSSPSFMKTALGSRSKRFPKLSTKTDNNPQLTSDNWEWYSRNSSNRSDSGSPSSLPLDHSDSMSNGREENATAKNGHHRGTSNESESGSSTTTPSTKRDKKMGRGLRKMCDGRKPLGVPDLRHRQRVVAL